MSRSVFSVLAGVLCLQNLSLGVEAATKEEKREFKDWSKLMDKFGYQWESHKVETVDGWILTMFHITGVNGKQPAKKGKNADRPPVLVQHGSFDSALAWSSSGLLGPAMPLQLVDNGFDVWMTNTRGVKYSNVHIRDGEIPLAEKWNFTLADMGEKDLPAFAEKILELTQKPKLTLLGYSQGSGQIFYALAKNQDYWEQYAERFVAIAPCIFGPPGPLTHDDLIGRFATTRQLGYYNYFGGDEATIDEDVACAKGICFPYDGVPAQSTASLEYMFQMAHVQRFQEPIPFEDFAAGQIYSEEISLTNIDRTPVSLVISAGDKTCPPDYPEWYYAEIQSEKHLRYEQGVHIVYSLRTGDAFVNRMVQTLDRGYVGDAATTGLTAMAGVLAASLALAITM